MLSILVISSCRLLECSFSFSIYVSFLSLPTTSRSASIEDFRTSSLTWLSSFWISLTLKKFYNKTLPENWTKLKPCKQCYKVTEAVNFAMHATDYSLKRIVFFKGLPPNRWVGMKANKWMSNYTMAKSRNYTCNQAEIIRDSLQS